MRHMPNSNYNFQCNRQVRNCSWSSQNKKLTQSFKLKQLLLALSKSPTTDITRDRALTATNISQMLSLVTTITTLWVAYA